MLSKFGKKSGIFGATAALVAAPLIAATVSAHAEPSPAPDAKALLSCDLSGTAAFAPALSMNPAGADTQLKVDGQATNCAPAGRAAEGVVSATFTGDMAGKMSCTSLPRGVGGDVDITWKYEDGSTKTSKANFELNLEGDLTNASKPAGGAFTGKTTSGEFAESSHKGSAQFDLASAAGGCMAGGLNSLDFAGKYELSQ
ncbi:hypothetical protein E1202_07185 [Saccharopolyspora karakumensis]|uniref:Ig-like domain-containing protein n=1 Tax=Saccharopolyspora karakumensis TaxID=2530386 RepID=A0A4R5BYD8_9PSEU|nr:hypothetical protein [Saccharopolyspora karakumensis]TDD90886.1 hypothetical protein E1202_07185 [Saccharopolyspora karakumensis]